MSTKRVVLAEYFIAGNAILLFIVRKDFTEPEVIELPISSRELRDFVSMHFVLLKNDGAISALQAWHDISTPLIEPVISWSDAGDILWFVPHDVLHYLPLHAAHVNGGQQYLIERNPVCYTPSASVMRYCQNNRRGRREKAFVLGDSRNNLLYAYEESLAVAGLFGTRAHLREHATKTLVKDTLQTYRDDIDVLHFSCHGRFRSDDALKSSIELAPETSIIDTDEHANDEERWNLTAEEIFRLSMKADLVTVSACESGMNDRKPGDELIGLTRALIYAGTPSVLVSLWSVDSLSTSMLMQHFYQQLLKPRNERGTPLVTKVEALRLAQLSIKEMTAQELFDFCTQRLSESTIMKDQERVLSFSLGQAYAQLKAQDLSAALQTYRVAQQQATAFPTNTSALAQIRDSIDALEFLTEEPTERSIIDYRVRPFEHPYYWAPFILIGDWM